MFEQSFNSAADAFMNSVAKMSSFLSGRDAEIRPQLDKSIMCCVLKKKKKKLRGL